MMMILLLKRLMTPSLMEDARPQPMLLDFFKAEYLFYLFLHCVAKCNKLKGKTPNKHNVSKIKLFHLFNTEVEENYHDFSCCYLCSTLYEVVLLSQMLQKSCTLFA